MKPHPHCEVIKAWADGAEVETRRDDRDEWLLANRPIWDTRWEYRVRKPKTKYTYRVYLRKDHPNQEAYPAVWYPKSSPAVNIVQWLDELKEVVTDGR